MSKVVSFLVSVLLCTILFGHTVAAEDNITSILARIPSDKDVLPCWKPIPISSTKLTRAVISMEPFRGVNLIFPFKLQNDSTSYYLSSDKIWAYERAKGQKTVYINYKEFEESWFGEVHDFSVTVGNYKFSLALKAEPGNHCTNIEFTFTAEEKKRFEEQEKKGYLETLRKEYERKFNNLDKQAEIKALSLVGMLALSDDNKESINEESDIELSNGDAIVVLVESILNYGKFYVVPIEIENDSNNEDIYIESITLFSTGASLNQLQGSLEFKNRVKATQVLRTAFTSLDPIPVTGGLLRVKTDKGIVEVSW